MPPPKILLEPPTITHEFVKPPNVFGKEDLGENGEGVEMPQNLTIEIQKLYDEGKIKRNFSGYSTNFFSKQKVGKSISSISTCRI